MVIRDDTVDAKYFHFNSLDENKTKVLAIKTGSRNKEPSLYIKIELWIYDSNANNIITDWRWREL